MTFLCHGSYATSCGYMKHFQFSVEAADLVTARAKAMEKLSSRSGKLDLSVRRIEK